jgi:hypothetical protein
MDFLKWIPWTNFFTEVFLLQFLMLYILYNIYANSNLFYVIFYTLAQIVLFGVFLAFYQMDLFSAFLWLAESVVIFVSLLLVFYLNVYGSVNKNNTFFYGYKFFGLLIMLCFTTHFFLISFDNESSIEFLIEPFVLFDNWYESIYNEFVTDLFGLFLSYYYINSLEFLIIVFFLLIGSLICVNLSKLNRLNRVAGYGDMFLVFDFFKDFVKFIFMRKQNLVEQENHPASTRIFKKKIK